jgi:hypothetical protein
LSPAFIGNTHEKCVAYASAAVCFLVFFTFRVIACYDCPSESFLGPYLLAGLSVVSPTVDVTILLVGYFYHLLVYGLVENFTVLFEGGWVYRVDFGSVRGFDLLL